MNKHHTKVWDADLAIRRALPVGAEAGVKLTVELVAGFELFNTRPYHNHETWSTGWRITGPVGEAGTEPTVTAEAEDLDDAFALWLTKRNAARVPAPRPEGDV